MIGQATLIIVQSRLVARCGMHFKYSDQTNQTVLRTVNRRRHNTVSTAADVASRASPPKESVSSVGIAGGLGVQPPVNVFNPPSCASLPVLGGGVRNNPHRSQLQTLICHHFPQVIEPCHCCQAYVPYPQSYSYCVLLLSSCNIISVL